MTTNGEVHTYDTCQVLAERLDETSVLVGQCGGLSAVFGVPEVALSELFVETEHGMLTISVGTLVEVLA